MCIRDRFAGCCVLVLSGAGNERLDAVLEGAQAQGMEVQWECDAEQRRLWVRHTGRSLALAPHGRAGYDAAIAAIAAHEGRRAGRAARAVSLSWLEECLLLRM
eukprot:6747248-Prymnesium_polylepis.1